MDFGKDRSSPSPHDKDADDGAGLDPGGPVEENGILRAIFDNLPATINCKDSGGRYVFMNMHQARQLGIDPDQAIGKTTAELYGSDWGEIVRQQDAEVLKSGKVLGPYREDYNSLGCKEGHWLTYKFPVTSEESGPPCHVATISFDITRLYETEQHLASVADTDALTGLLNRRWFDRHLEELEATDEPAGAHAISKRRTQAPGILVIDLDHFKRVNDTWGHEAGDAVLKQVANALKAAVGVEGTVVRLGGEEFVVLMQGVSRHQLFLTAECIRVAVANQALDTIARDLRITVSIGCSLQEAGQPLRQAIRDADLALYRAKGAGRNRIASSWPDSGRLSSVMAS